MKTRSLIPLLTAALLGACASVTCNRVTGQRELTVMDEKSEIAEGGVKAHHEVIKEYGVVNDAALQAYVDGVGQKLAAASYRAKLKWTWPSPASTAWRSTPSRCPAATSTSRAASWPTWTARPSWQARSGTKIAMPPRAMAHSRQSTPATAGVGVGLATIGGALLEMATWSARVAQAAGSVAQAGAAGLIASYSRDQELEANEPGAEYLVRGRYDPANMVEVIQALKDQEPLRRLRPPRQPAAQRPRRRAGSPRTRRRRATAADPRHLEAPGRQPAGGVRPDEERDRYLRAVDGLGFGDGREQGVARGRQLR